MERFNWQLFWHILVLVVREMKNENLPWPERYRPKKLEHIVGNPDAISRIKDWIFLWKRGIPEKRAILLIGPPGTGKTASVGALSNELDMELVEFNSSDKRNKDSIETLVWRAASQQTLDGRPRIILLDEVDGLSGTSDRGGVGAISKVVKETVHPIIMTANDPDSPRLKDLFKICQVLIFEPIEHDSIVDVLRNIADQNKIDITQDVISEIAETSAGDLRAAISDLEAYAKRGAAVVSIGSGTRNIRRGTEETIQRLFMTQDPKVARRTLSESELDYDSILLWLEENIHLHLLSPNELNLGFDGLSLADLFLGRIMRNQNWKLLSYFYDFLATGVAVSRTITPYRKVNYSKSTWPLLVWQGNQSRDKKSDALSALSRVSGVSKSRSKHTHFDTITNIVTIRPSLVDDYSNWLGIDKASLRRKKS
ncbi:replication factor C large subunit [Candidatus Thorarchaeota archaeon]|nr:MAG: replication factor C large subunit [Candidatus Thorarchaeota archaeon]